jgi:hypothetical protein
MFKKILDKLKTQPPKAEPPQPKLLTAEGWKRLMMKKARKTGP